MKMIISNSSSVPIYEQIKNSIIEQIMNDELKEDDAIPSIRSLAQDIKISVMTIKKAIDGKKEKRAWKDCVGKVSAEYIYLYPPGSPIIAPGEMMTEQVLKEISIYKKQGLNVLGPADDTLKEIMTVK